MAASVVLRFLTGDPRAIRIVASSRAAFWTGLLLVLLTAIARNYDQTFVLEKPFLWVFGPLLFSLVSGTWVFLVAYGIAWGGMGPERPQLWSAWPAFMGLFWMTAPIAWLYAIPVERLFDSVTAAKANAVLLAIVSLWRVLLMARVIQVLHGARFLMALSWVLIPVTLEVLPLILFGGGLEKRIMAGMMGMRNSPEEQVLLNAMSIAGTAALWLLPVAVLTTIVWRVKAFTTPLPPREDGRIPWKPIGWATAFWLIAAIVAQPQVARNASVDALVQQEKFREALDYLSAHRRSDFAPSRTLPPKPFEREIFEQLAGLLGAVRTSDAPWVHQHLIVRLNEMCGHFRRPWDRAEEATGEKQVEDLYNGMEWAQRYGRLTGAGFRAILSGLQGNPAGASWLQTNNAFLGALAKLASEAPVHGFRDTRPEEAQRADWKALAEDLSKLGVLPLLVSTNFPESTSVPP